MNKDFEIISVSASDLQFNEELDGIIPKGWADMFVGILMVDATVGNSDRHDRNIDIVRQSNGQFYLSPVFDHGYSLGASENNDLRGWIDPQQYNQYHNSSSFSYQGEDISGYKAFEQAAELRPEAAKIWLHELQKIDFRQIEQIFSQIPSNAIVPEAIDFALKLLEYNQKQLLSLNIAFNQTDVQQKKVELIAPVLLDYLRLDNLPRRENETTIVEYDSASKTISYQNKIEQNQYLKAQYIDNKWINRGSNISESKELEILNKAAPLSQKRHQLKKQQDKQNESKSSKGRRR